MEDPFHQEGGNNQGFETESSFQYTISVTKSNNQDFKKKNTNLKSNNTNNKSIPKDCAKSPVSLPKPSSKFSDSEVITDGANEGNIIEKAN